MVNLYRRVLYCGQSPRVDGIDAGVDLLNERIESLSSLEQERVRKRVEELIEKFTTLLNLIIHGEPVND